MLSPEDVIVQLISRHLLPSLRAAASPEVQNRAAYTIQQLLALLRDRMDLYGSPDVELVEVGGAATSGLQHKFDAGVRANP
jgi:hypothetical protein